MRFHLAASSSAALLLLLATATAEAITVDGTVFVDTDSDGVFSAGDTPLAGVVVSFEGRVFATTDTQGRYTLDATAGLVWVRTPDGYDPSPVWGVISGDVDQTVDLILEPASVIGPLTMIVASDTHVSNPYVDWGPEALEHVLAQATEMEPPPHFLTITGDITQANRPGEFADVIAATADIGVPFVPVPGNHDWYDGGAAYRLNFGPDKYSFDAGGVHHIIINAMDTDTSNVAFVEADLAFNIANLPVIVYNHASPTAELAAELDRLGVSHMFTGHWHSNRVVERGDMLEINTQTLIMGGIDFTPAGYRVVSLENGALTMYHRTIVEEPVITVTNPLASECVSAAPFEILAAVEIAAGELQVTARIDGGDPISLIPDGGWTFRGAAPVLQSGSHQILIEAFSGGVARGARTTSFRVCDDSLGAAILVDWPQHQGGPEHHGSTDTPITPPLRTAWVTSVGGHIQGGSVVVADARVFVPIVDLTDATRGGVVALDARTGARLWRYDTGYAVRNSPAVSGETVIFADNNAVVHAVRATDGSLVWSHDLGAGLDRNVIAMYAAPTVVDGTAYLGIQRNFVALDVATGAQKWSVDPSPQGSWLGSYTAAGVIDGVVIGAFSRGIDGMVAWSADTGEERWRLPRPAATAVNTSIVTADGRAFFGRANGTMYGVDAQTGAIEWATGLSPTGFDWGYDLAATPAYHDGQLFVPVQRGTFHALDAETGAEQWRISAAGAALVHPTHYEARVEAFSSSPAVTGDIVWIGGADGRLSAHKIDSGAEIWSRDLGSPVLSGIVPAGDYLFVATYDGTLRALAPRALWLPVAPAPAPEAPMPVRDAGCACAVAGGPRPAEIVLWLLMLGWALLRPRRLRSIG